MFKYLRQYYLWLLTVHPLLRFLKYPWKVSTNCRHEYHKVLANSLLSNFLSSRLKNIKFEFQRQSTVARVGAILFIIFNKFFFIRKIISGWFLSTLNSIEREHCSRVKIKYFFNITFKWIPQSISYKSPARDRLSDCLVIIACGLYLI